jgi:hypothetical protein
MDYRENRYSKIIQGTIDQRSYCPYLGRIEVAHIFINL